MVTTLLQLERRPAADAADALAVALCHAQTRRLAALLAAPRVRRVTAVRVARPGLRA